MSGFSFPPPPPPPPQAFYPDQYQQSHRGGFGDRGSRGRGRGRGRGDPRGGLQRGGRGNQNGSFAPRPQTYAPNGFTDPTKNGQIGSSQASTGILPLPQPYNTGLPYHTPAMAASQNGSQAQRFGAPSPHANTGIKRSHVQAFDNKTIGIPNPKPESKPKVAAPPVVPSFGFALPALTASVQSSTQAVPEPAQTKKKPRTKNSLGLTPKGEVYEDSGDDVDEEASFAQSSQGVIQHGGRSIQLNTAADVAAWIAERRKNFPTAAKIAVRKAAQDKAREEAREVREVERIRRQEERDGVQASKLGQKRRGQRGDTREIKAEKIKQEDVQPVRQNAPQAQPVSQPDPIPDDPLARIAQLEEQLRQAREALLNPPKPVIQAEVKTEPVVQETPAKIKDDPEDNPVMNEPPLLRQPAEQAQQPWPNMTSRALGLAYESADDEDDSEVKSVALSDISSVVSSDSENDSDSDSDAPPEQASSKGILRVAPPPRNGPNKSQICFSFQNTGRCKYGKTCNRSHDVPCRFYARTGQCKYGDKCRMSHDITPGTGGKKKPSMGNAERSVSKTMSLRERMVEQELREEARLGLQVIKELGANGFFDA